PDSTLIAGEEVTVTLVTPSPGACASIETTVALSYSATGEPPFDALAPPTLESQTDTTAAVRFVPQEDGVYALDASLSCDFAGSPVQRSTFTSVLVGSGTGTSSDDSSPDATVERVVLQNYPNPFNPTTTIRYGLSEAADVRLEVLDLLGRRVATPAEGQQAAGWHEVRFEAGGLASGVYIYRLTVGDETVQRKMLLLK
ncbi:MAG: T9SS type A sorting domain-containing protein, partial [Bacteroidota bacterium]